MNNKEIFKSDLKKYIKLSETIKEINKEKEDLHYKIWDYRYLDYNDPKKSDPEVIKEFNNNYDLEIKKDSELKQKEIESNILYNNLCINLINDIKEDIKNLILEYKDKNIGPKTKEKLQDQAYNIIINKYDDLLTNRLVYVGTYPCREEAYKKGYIYFNQVGCYYTEAELNFELFINDYLSLEIIFYMYYEDSSEKINPYFIIKDKKGYNTETTLINECKRYESNNYIYINNIPTEAKKIINKSKKDLATIKELEKKLHDIKSDLNNNIDILALNPNIKKDLSPEYKITLY